MSSDSTLDEIEGPGWSDPDFPSAMVQRIRALGRVPLRAFTAEDYRLIITQQRALGTLVPLALDLLQTEPFAEEPTTLATSCLPSSRSISTSGRLIQTCAPMRDEYSPLLLLASMS